jgi:hypothetical protein
MADASIADEIKMELMLLGQDDSQPAVQSR